MPGLCINTNIISVRVVHNVLQQMQPYNLVRKMLIFQNMVKKYCLQKQLRSDFESRLNFQVQEKYTPLLSNSNRENVSGFRSARRTAMRLLTD